VKLWNPADYRAQCNSTEDPLLFIWNRLFYAVKQYPEPWRAIKRREEMRWRMVRRWLEINRKVGKGNRAWKRAAALDRQPGVLIWPDYAL
jgi:hypothetical protein